MKRYIHGTPGLDHSQGAWVKYEDIAKLKEENERLKGEVYKAVKNWHDTEQDRDRLRKALEEVREYTRLMSCGCWHAVNEEIKAMEE